MNILPQKSVVKTYNKLSKLPLGCVTAGGWIKEQLQRSKDGMGGHLDELEPDMIATPHISYSGFDRLPFMEGPLDPTFVAGWSGEISGTYWTGLVQLAFTLNDEELIAKAERWVNGVLKHQEADGYLGSFSPETDRMVDYNPWASAWCYRALISYYEATGRKDVFDAVYRGCLWFCENWKNNKTYYCGTIIIEIMVIAYAYTGDYRLIQFCNDWLDWLEDNSKWQNKVSQYLSDSLPYSSMHTVAYGENVKNPAILYSATGDERLLRASQNGLDKALKKIVHATGGPSSSAEHLSPTGSTNEVEYCNFCTYNHSYSWMAMITGESVWGDYIERCLFNGAQGSRKKDERAIAYFASPNQFFATRKSSLFGDEPDYGVYAPCFYVACCPAQSVRILPEFVRSMIMQDRNNNIYLCCYGPAEVKSPNFECTMDTLYPFRDTIKLKINKSTDSAVFFRIPKWCKIPKATINGENIDLKKGEDGFALLETSLKKDDEIIIVFPMEVKISKIDDSAACGKFPMVIERGPLVYSLPIAIEWKEYPGRPITPLPESWSWYEAMPIKEIRTFDARRKTGWHKAIDENIDPNTIKVLEHETDGYVWEDPPITLEVPLYHSEFAYMPCTNRQQEPWGETLEVKGPAEYCRLVPHGCTNLRVTYFPRAKI